MIDKSEDLINRLREGVVVIPKRWAGDTFTDLGCGVDEEAIDRLMAEAAEEISRLREAVAALDDADASLRFSDINRALTVAFIWGQRRERILNGEETWADQNLRPAVFGGPKKDS